jgi:hypothetical protein
LFFDSTNERLTPIHQTNQADRDAAIDLGYASSRFKDLYTMTVQASTGTASAPAYSFAADTNSGMYLNSADTLCFSTAGSEAMRIDSNGSAIFAGTSANQADSITIHSTNYIWADRTNGEVLNLNRRSTNGKLAIFYKDVVEVGSISTNANSLPSDRNFKTNINDLTLGLDFVTSLKPVTYNYKIDDEGSPVMSGLIAQDVEESLDAAGVEKNSMTILQHEPTDDEQQSDYQMDYLKLVPVLINAIKELQAEVAALKGA